MFQVNAQRAHIRNLNLRKEAAGEDEAESLAADIKLELTEAPAALLKMLASASPGQNTIVDSLFTDAGVPRFLSFEEISFDVKFENHDISIGGRHFANATLKGFTVLKLYDGAKVDLEFTAQVHPEEQQVGSLAEKIKNEVVVNIVGTELPLGHHDG